MILDLYKDSFEFAGQDFKVLLKLGILSILSFFIIPAFLISGYQYRVVSTGINGMIGGDDKLPSFENLTGMFVDGIKYFVTQLIYFVVPIIIFGILFYLGQYFNNYSLIMLSVIVGVILFIVSMLYWFIALPNMVANNGSFKAAFDFSRLNEIIKMIGAGRFIVFYIGILLIVFVVSIVVFFILSAIFGLFGLAILTINPSASFGLFTGYSLIFEAIFAFIVGPYLSIFVGRATGLIYAVGE